MQYGNDDMSDEEIEALSGLNRTMQYGNEAGVGVIHMREKSLNRTMQYGNKNVEEIEIYDRKV